MTKGSLTVNGVGKIAVKPDQITLALNLRTEAKEYEAAVLQANEKLNSLTAAIVSAGFAAQDLKTSSLAIDAYYEYVRTDDGRQMKEFQGYIYTQLCQLKFPLEMTRLAETIAALSQSKAAPELELSFTIADPAKVSAELLRLATADARQKAEVIAAASAVTLGEIKNITYGTGSHDFPTPRNRVTLRSCSAAPLVDAVPEELLLEDTITITWKLK
ncbi:SIMPL domain-containing protein [Candidatus Methanomassiliicoccus intestinalis]|uniref:SIMPL domain-containing protein n=1 Tax=Candidatus Methanomassiliicoccus intestinalis TaxID=1406512 RepID=UPI0037DCE813